MCLCTNNVQHLRNNGPFQVTMFNKTCGRLYRAKYELDESFKPKCHLHIHYHSKSRRPIELLQYHVILKGLCQTASQGV